MSKRNSARRSPATYKPQKQSAAQTYAQRARIYYQEDQPQRAIPLLEQAVELAPQSAAFQRELGRALIAAKRPGAGIERLQQSLDIDPGFIPALIELGQEYTKQNAFEKAQPLLDKAQELAPDNPATQIVYGTFLQKQGDLPNAAAHFRDALKLRLDRKLKPGSKPHSKEAFNKAETEQLMWDTLSLLAKSGLHVFASYGTLLGLVREGGLLPFDKDLDFGLPLCELDLASRCLESNGWIEQKTQFLTNPRAFLHPLKGVSLDLAGFVVDQSSQETFTGFWLPGVPHAWNRTAKYPQIDLQKATAPDGQPIWALRDPECWLETLYGDWRTPDPNFDTVICAKNLCGFSLLTQCYAFARMYSKWEKGYIQKALVLVEQSLHYLPDDALLRELGSHLRSLLPKNQPRGRADKQRDAMSGMASEASADVATLEEDVDVYVGS